MTFSIIARDPETGHFGVAVSTAVPCVGAMVPHVKPGVGAIATQSFTNVRLGVDGLKLIELGLTSEAALISLLVQDEEAGKRQVAGIDRDNTPFVYSGDGCVDWYGSHEGEHYCVQGNMLVGEETISAMAEAFEASEGFLGDRLIRALEAGQAAGGDKRGRSSAALLVAPLRHDDELSKIDIRVDEHTDPVAELRRLGDMVIGHFQEVLDEERELLARKLEAEKS
jgi:uncharacterized Ntn-hydrolase superfamily protein